MGKEFNTALSNFISDFAAGGAIRHLADEGLSLAQICDRLDYPMSREKVAKIVWQHYLDQGIVCLEEPQSIQNRVSYVKEQDSYGKISMRRVVDKVDASDRKYIKIDFGKRIYKDKAAFEKELTLLEPADREYILGLPWPLHDVYFLIDERVSRWINSGLIIE